MVAKTLKQQRFAGLCRRRRQHLRARDELSRRLLRKLPRNLSWTPSGKPMTPNITLMVTETIRINTTRRARESLHLVICNDPLYSAMRQGESGSGDMDDSGEDLIESGEQSVKCDFRS